MGRQTTLPTDVLRQIATGTSTTQGSAGVEAAEFGQGDLVKGSSSGGTWYGRVRDMTTDGEFSDEITTGSGDDADQTVSGSEDNPAYLIQIMQESGEEDGPDWQPGDAVVAHREQSVETWSPTGSVAEATQAATGTAATGTVSVQGEGDAGLTGVVWSAGTHNLHVNGKPTRVYVPPETIESTYNHITQAVESGDPPGIGVDHYDGLAADDVPVAADTGLLEIGQATDFALSDDGQSIVMTGSDLTSPQAQQVAGSGGFDGLDYSIVGDILLATGQDGEPAETDSGALMVDAVRIHRVDVVETGAVDSASVGHVPTLAAGIAASNPGQDAQWLTDTLRATTTTTRDKDMGDFDPGSFSDMSAAVEAAADVIDEKDNRIDELEAQVAEKQTKADAFEQVAASFGFDPTDDAVSAQDVVDAQTESLRAEIAEMEQSLASYEVPDKQDRVDDLAGSSVDELQALRGERATEILRTEAEYDARNSPVPAGTGRGQASGGSSGADNDQADDLAKQVMGGRDVIEARQTDQSPAEFLSAKYGVAPADYKDEQSLRAAINGDSA